MNRSRLLMIGGLALAVGLLVSFTVYNRLRTSAGSNSNERGVPVVVAADDIQVGAKLEAHDVRVITLPQSAVPPGRLLRTHRRSWAAAQFCRSARANLFCPANWRR